MDLNQALRRAVAVNPQGLALIDGELRRDWSQVGDRVARLAQGLADLGVGQGDRVALLAANSGRYYESLFALFALGAVAVPLNWRLAEPELRFQIGDAGARMLLVDDGLAGMGRSLADICPLGLVHIGDDVASTPHSEQLIAASGALPARQIADHNLAAIFYTGGTTGLPKGVMHSHRTLHAMATGLIMQLRLDERCIVLHAAPMFHLADFAIFVVTLLAATHVIIPALDDRSLLDAMAQHRVTHCFTVPAVIDRIARSPDLPARDLSHLKVLGYGGAPMPWGTYLHARAALPQIDFVQGFGMTEMPSVTFLGERWHRQDADPERLKSAGQPGFGYEVRVVGRDGREVPRGTVGEIVGRGDNVTPGYWNRPEETAAALRDGWLHSGDAGYIDEAGFLYITDRFKDMIVTGGENVYSIEVENVLSTHPAVRECAIIGLPDVKWGERVHAIVVTQPAKSLPVEEMIAHCRAALAGYKIPRTLTLRDIPLPRSAAGKVLKRQLREELGA